MPDPSRHRYRVACVLLFAVSAAWSQDEDTFEPVELPPEMAAGVAGLPQEKIDFLRGDGIFGFAERHDLLFDQLSAKSPAEIKSYIDAMMRENELMKFNPDTDPTSIPLNTESDGFNGWKVRRPTEIKTVSLT